MGTGEISIRWARSPEDVREALAVREEVFCREQGVPRSDEVDGLDGRALHLVAVEPGAAGRVVGTLRVLLADGRARIGRVAVEREWRRRGLASHMLEMAIELARERGCVDARLAAQTVATGLYERAGFSIESAPFQEAGIPHVWMGLALDVGDASRGEGAPH
jgi:putative N-acetyltransferase (TIGR04045 family)